MSLSLFARKVLVCACVGMAVSAVVRGQTYTNNGSEYPMTGGLPGDQVWPALSVNTNGGYLVWQDRWTDGDGFGISGQALNNRLQATFASFRINQVGAGDQENAQVALLKNNGAVFVWQGGKNGFQHIYARFLSSSNTWATDDTLVNTFDKNSQINPAVAVLENGNVIVVWASYDQAGSATMQDVYGQEFTPDGQKVGDEFLVNEFTAYNQRTPSVAALKSGGFAVAWVSEQQRTYANLITGQLYTANNIPQPSVDIYARLYDSTGKALGNEFLVNEHSNVCANPTLAVSDDGSILAAWSEKDTQVRNNSWDIFAARISIGSGSIPTVGNELRQNTQLYGDQFAPHVSALGSKYLLVWTSLGQDGSMEGVYGRYLNADGSSSGDEFRINTTTISKQMQPAVAADGSQRFISVWTSFIGGSNSFDLFGQQYAPAGYVQPDLATNYLAPAFVAGGSTSGNPGTGDGGTGGNTGGSNGGAVPILSFPGIVSTGSNVVSDPIEADQGLYCGLFYDTNGVTTASSGYLTVKVTKKGTFSAKLIMTGAKYSASDRFDPSSGLAIATTRGRGTPLRLALRLDLSGGTQLTGTVSVAGRWSAQVFAERVVFDKTHPARGYFGNYTLAFPADALQGTAPAGNGYGTLTVSTSGSVKWKGALADGTKVSQSSAISGQGILPMFAASRNGEFLIGWIQFSKGSGSDLNGPVVWIKSGGSQSSPGFTNEVQTLGSLYTGRVSPVKPLSLDQTVLILDHAGLGSGVTNRIGLDSRGQITAQDGAKLKLKIAPTGLFNGSVEDPETGRPMKIQGAFLEKPGVGLGSFTRDNESGGVYFGPNQ